MYGQHLELHNDNCETITCTCRLQPHFCGPKMTESIGSSWFVICISMEKNIGTQTTNASISYM